jgi:hypothetical protein
MTIDRYTQVVLTVIAIALVYLCVVFTPLPTVHAQRGLRPGDDTGPAQVVVVGWRTPDQVPVQVVDSIPMKVTGEVRVTGSVQTEQARNVYDRVVMVGWEERAVGDIRSGASFRAINSDAKNASMRGVPVTAYAPQ